MGLGGTGGSGAGGSGAGTGGSGTGGSVEGLGQELEGLWQELEGLWQEPEGLGQELEGLGQERMWLGQELVMVRVRVLPEVTAHQSSPKMHMTSYTKCTCARSSWLKTFDVVLTSAFLVSFLQGNT